MAKKFEADKDLVAKMKAVIIADDDGRLVVPPDAHLLGMVDDDVKQYKAAVDVVGQVDKHALPNLAIAMGSRLIEAIAAEDPEENQKPQTELVAKLHGGRQLTVGVQRETGDDGMVRFEPAISLEQPKAFSKALQAATGMLESWDV